MNLQTFAAFTHDGQGGNPAGVVISGAFPTSEEMLGIAADVGFSETVFAVPEGDGYRVRYFSPEAEVPFCGHATIALGAALASSTDGCEVPLATGDGVVTLTARLDGGVAHAAFQSKPPGHSQPTDEMVREASALFGLSQGDLDSDLPPWCVNAGNNHVLLSLQSRELLRAMHYDLEAGRAFMQRYDLVTTILVWRESDHVFHARNAFASSGIFEDPATGSAAAALGGLLRDRGLVGPPDFTIFQGADMGQPCQLNVTARGPVGAPVSVSGTSVCLDESAAVRARSDDRATPMPLKRCTSDCARCSAKINA
jgi:PhzF family phenazine biosynthesis protein